MGEIWEPPELVPALLGVGLAPTEGVRGGRQLEGWRYVVVDELIESAATLVSSPWPTVDGESGRRLFGDADEDVEVGVGVERFQRILDERRLVPDPALQQRPVRIGDVFAITSWDMAILEDEERVAGIPEITIIDVTASAREAAKVAFRRAVVASETVDQGETRRQRVAVELERAASDAPPDVREAVDRTLHWLRGEG